MSNTLKIDVDADIYIREYVTVDRQQWKQMSGRERDSFLRRIIIDEFVPEDNFSISYGEVMPPSQYQERFRRANDVFAERYPRFWASTVDQLIDLLNQHAIQGFTGWKCYGDHYIASEPHWSRWRDTKHIGTFVRDELMNLIMKELEASE